MQDDVLKAYHKQLADFCRMAKDHNFVVLDTETTGLHDGEIVEIAIVAKSGEVLLNTQVKPFYPIPSDATRIHGITDEMVAQAPTWVDLIAQVEPLVTGVNVMVWNAVYDRKMMHQTTEYWNLLKRDWKTMGAWHCAMEAYAIDYGEWNAYRGSFKWQKLTTAAQSYRLPISDAHSALGDAKMTLAVINAMVNNHAYDD